MSTSRMAAPRAASRSTRQAPRRPELPVTRQGADVMPRTVAGSRGAGEPAADEVAVRRGVGQVVGGDRVQHLGRTDAAHAERLAAAAHLQVVVRETRAAEQIAVEDEIVLAARAVVE